MWGRGTGAFPHIAADAAAMRRLDGQRLVEGVAIGRAWLHEPRVEVTRLLAENPQAELVRLDHATEALRATLDQMLATSEIGITKGRKAGVATSSPSTADSTEMAGVMTPSP